MEKRLPLIAELETSDPDDFLTLLWLADHPQVDLRAVMVTPGGEDQCRLVRWGLDRCERKDVPIGSHHDPTWWKSTEGQKQRVSQFHYKVYGAEAATHATGTVVHGLSLLGQLLRDPQAGITYLTGCAPKCLGQAMREYGELRLERWVAQGFFAGMNVVAPEHQLEKFKGKTTRPSFNPGGDPKSALELLASDHIRRRVAVSKNVCHGVVWTKDMQERLLVLLQERHKDPETGKVDLRFYWPGIPQKTRYGMQWMIHGLDRYLADKGVGKAMHDILAAAACLDESVVELREVDIYRERGEWGSRAKSGTRTWISVAYNQESFLDVLAH
jgi:pyrimidine-specific ribonucleoside hydrolase